MWLTVLMSVLLLVCFAIVIYITSMILDYLESKPSGRKTLMDELNKVVLYCFMLITLSNYPLTLVLTLGLDLGRIKYVAAFLALTR